jgi:hypothetical protein
MRTRQSPTDHPAVMSARVPRASAPSRMPGLEAVLAAAPRDRSIRSRSVIFLLASLVPFAIAVMEPSTLDARSFYAAALTMTAVVVGSVMTPWMRLPHWLALLPPLGYLVVIGLLRHSERGVTGIISAMSLLPVFWVAMYGNRRDLTIVLLGVAAMFDLPVVLFGSDRYHLSDIVQGTVVIIVGAVIGLGIERMVGGIRSMHAELASTVSGSLDGFISTNHEGRILV